jgi:hypothetical protein
MTYQEPDRRLQPGVPKNVKAAGISANEQIERERRNRISPEVFIVTEGQYRAALCGFSQRYRCST